jgi:hypothetical protein
LHSPSNAFAADASSEARLDARRILIQAGDAHVDTISLHALCFSHTFVEEGTCGDSYFSGRASDAAS